MNKIYILDTNVLLHDPHSLNAFEDNEVVIPLVVLDELDKKKQGPDETAKHARMVIRSLDKLRLLGSIHEGVATATKGLLRVELNHRDKCPDDLDPNRVDNRLIGVALGLMEEESNNQQRKVTLITKDINLRVKCDAMGVPTADYNADSVAENPSSIYEGAVEVDVDSKMVDDLHNDGFVDIIDMAELHPNQYVNIRSNINPKHSGLAKVKGNALVKISTFDNVWGISSRNREQAFALDALFDPEIKLVTLIGKAGSGKAEPLDATVYTINGPKKMGDIKTGDRVSTPDGRYARVSGVYPQGEKDIYRVSFQDGSSVECCDEHLWLTKTSRDRDSGKPGSIKELSEIRKTLRRDKSNKRNHSIPITKPVYFEYRSLPVDPYVLGCLIGDGTLTQKTMMFTSADREIVEAVNESLAKLGSFLKQKRSSNIDYYINGTNTREELKKLGLHGKRSNSKFIPDEYLYSGVEQRIDLLRGLMDTDGTVNKGHTTYTSVSKRLAENIRCLVQSLGGTARIVSRITRYTDSSGNKKDGQISYRVNICMPNEVNPFRLSRKASSVKKRVKYFPRRYVDRVEYVGKKEAQCISIDSEDHLYITDDFIVTHNTLMAAASGIAQLLDSHIYKKLIMTRPVQPLGRDIGFLPGSKEEKLAPWMAPLQDNLDLLFSGKGKNYLDMQRDAGLIEVEALTYIRGRSIPRSFIIVDEAQNLTLHEIKTIITRVGDGSKVVLTGDIMQIDNPFIDSVDNGLSCVIEKFKHLPIAAHITLQKGERSELASLAAEIL